MKKSCFYYLAIIGAMLLSLVGCNKTPEPVEKTPVVIYDGPLDLADKGFGMYYGDRNGTSIAAFSIVLSDAVCFRDGYGDPYLDSEGDMLVLELEVPVDMTNGQLILPEGEYFVGKTTPDKMILNVDKSYVKRLVGIIQYHYDIKSGSLIIARNSEGTYDISTKDLILTKDGVDYQVEYNYSGNVKLDDWKYVSVTLLEVDDDLVDVPFDAISAVYYGNLFGYGTANYVVSLYTAGFLEDETGTLPGVMLVFNMFDEMPSGDELPLLTPGTYTVYPSFNSNEFSMLYGLSMDGVPFGTYVAQVDGKGAQALEFIFEGTVEVSRTSEAYNDVYTFEYSFRTNTRNISGKWVGPVDFSDQSTDSDRIVLSTLEDDVECDMHRIDRGYLSHIETLKTTPLPSIDIAEAWQLNLQPRGWTDEEKELPWDERIEAWDPNGDVMILEFVVPLGSKGDIAPEINKEYTYQIQPDLSMDDVLYEVSVSRMGRPYDDIFYEPNWGDYTYMTGVDARRGFTWDGYFRGNWYLHFLEGTYQNMDEIAPAVRGTVTVTRTTELKAASGGREAEFKIVWDLYDDSEASNNVTGEWTGPVTVYNGGDDLQ
ncbi:MAG: hypothetical protein IKW55_03855 [Bacteroidales bacterium]|nr:hypothetical protein [Bacteroidales bacterium]